MKCKWWKCLKINNHAPCGTDQSFSILIFQTAALNENMKMKRSTTHIKLPLRFALFCLTGVSTLALMLSLTDNTLAAATSAAISSSAGVSSTDGSGHITFLKTLFDSLTLGQYLGYSLLAALAYVLGSVPFGLVIAKSLCGVDPRTAGSGNIGSTNVARLCGFKYGVLTLLCDALKGLVPVSLALALSGSPFIASIVGLCALLGHLYSIFLGFKGGKAVATTVGVFLPLHFPSLIISALICIILIWRSGFVSLGSLALAALIPLCLLIFGRFELLPVGLIVCALIFFKHQENIKRLLRGEEKTFLKKKQNPDATHDKAN